MCTPPGWVPRLRCTSKNPPTSSSTSLNRRVLWPLGASNVLPCIGSQIQLTVAPCPVTARTSGGSASRIRPAPIRVIRLSRPGSLSGLSFSISVSTSAGLAVGPTLTPIGFLMAAANSRCAPAASRVRSPIHRKWPDRSYGSPVRLSSRVSACS